MKTLYVTIQKKASDRYFNLVIFCFRKCCKTNFSIFLLFQPWSVLGVKVTTLKIVTFINRFLPHTFPFFSVGKSENWHQTVFASRRSLKCTLCSVTEELEGKVKSRANYERLQELQSSLVWPPITELDPKTYVPEVRNPWLRYRSSGPVTYICNKPCIYVDTCIAKVLPSLQE